MSTSLPSKNEESEILGISSQGLEGKEPHFGLRSSSVSCVLQIVSALLFLIN
jgi:hypothetical protein